MTVDARLTSLPQKKPANSLTIALVGNPNCGKTTLFNALTGTRQRVGNWPGVTVERKSGSFIYPKGQVEVVDLPGIYSLILADTGGIDERIASEFVLSEAADIIINIVDASSLERHLYLTMQLLEMGVPVIVVLNMMDMVCAKNMQIDLAALSRGLHCPVLALEAIKKMGIETLKQAIVDYKKPATTHYIPTYPAPLQQAIQSLAAFCQTEKQEMLTTEKHAWLAMRMLEEDAYVSEKATPARLKEVATQKKFVQDNLGEDPDILLADARYQSINRLLQHCLTQTFPKKTDWTARIDSIVLNRFLGIPIFLGVMYLLFVFAINIGGAFQDFFDISSQTIFVEGFARLLTQLGAPLWLTALLANGIGKGINTTVTFIPVIGSMFLFLAFLEDSGYMARSAFVIDRFMRFLGLPGKAFVPMIVGFGCNVPAVMAARTLENKRDRILTIMMSPFMSCGARLAIYAVFTAAFFPRGGQNIVFALYLIGILMAILTGVLLRQTVLKGEAAPLVMELPPYHLPRFKNLVLHAWQRLKGFVFRAGKLIVPICVLIGGLNALNIDGTLNQGDADVHSVLSMVGQFVTPIFSPMGIHADNWPATVGLVTGILAKEVVVGTLNTLYTQVGHFAVGNGSEAFHFWASLQEALGSIPQNLAQLGEVFSRNPVVAQAPSSTVNQGVYGLMYQKFDGQVGAFAYLLFVLLYFPCVSTMAAMLREMHKGWSIFSAIWMTGVAYSVAVVFYQAATWGQHPVSSCLWIIALVAAFLITILSMRYYAQSRQTLTVSMNTIGG